MGRFWAKVGRLVVEGGVLGLLVGLPAVVLVLGLGWLAWSVLQRMKLPTLAGLVRAAQDEGLPVEAGQPGLGT